MQPEQSNLRVIVADDDVLLREGVASLLASAGYRVVGRVGEASSLIELVRAEKPDLAIVDIRMPPTYTADGLEAAMTIREEHPAVGLVILSAHVDVEQAMQLLASGRSVGYLLKTRVTDVGEFLDTVARIADGACVVDPALVQELVDARKHNDPLAVLSPREKDVLALMAEGRSNVGIARRLWVTEGTVEKHVRSIMGKLDLYETPDDHRRVRAVITFLEAR
ncbi:response regulator [Mycobacterium sherrisii]|uniref:response regulator n=1 Tax=Mycobacterium sherrisii TaxID=243061 RepID=UPI0039765033